jgi:nucleoside 2-deoxyribosyltransferase
MLNTYPTIYLCGPIQNRTDAQCVTWRETIKEHWPGVSLDPLRRDYRGREMENVAKLVRDDLDDIRRCDILLVYFDAPSVGTSMEIFFAHHILRIPVVTIDVHGRGRESPWLVRHTDVLVSTLPEALEVLKQVHPRA